MSKKLLITGGAGFIGTNLCEYFLAAGYEVSVVDNLSAGDRSRVPSEVHFHEVDIRETDTIEKIFSGQQFVIHLAAEPSVQYSIEEPVLVHDINVNGTLSVLQAATAAGVGRVVFAASSAAYGDQDQLPLSLDLPTQPKSPYALHKVIGEKYMKLWSQLYDLETVSLRFFNVYGPYFDPNGPYASVIGRFLHLAKKGKPLTVTGTGEQTRDFVHVKDIAAAVLRTIEAGSVGAGEVLNVGSGRATSVLEVAKHIAQDIEFVPPRIEPMHSVADISKTKQILDWEPTIDFIDGLADLRERA